jgi:clan AA aspartic protease
MALTHLKVYVSRPGDGKKAEPLRFLVDSGAIYSVAPKGVLGKLGVKPEEEREFTLADGSVIKRKMGTAKFQFEKYQGGAPVIFGEKGDTNLLGATILGAMGVALDPLRRKLIALPMVLG